MNYDVQIGNVIRRGIPYAELIILPINSDTFVRRENGEWIHAEDCVELTHIIAERTISSEYQTFINDYIEEDEYINDGVFEIENEDKDEITGPPETYFNPTHSTPHVQHYPQPNNIREERIFIPTAEYFKCKQKRKAAIIGVCTLGLAGLSLMGVGNTWRSNIFAGTSLSAHAGMGFVLKCISFCFLTTLIAIPYFIYSVFALIYYSIRLSNLKR